MQIEPLRAGAAVGLLMGVWHAGWSLLVALGWAQPLIDFIFWIHFIQPIYIIGPFSLTRAIVLVIVTGLVGFAIGVAFAAIWNRLHRRQPMVLSPTAEAGRRDVLGSRG